MNLVEQILKNVKDVPTLPTVYSALCDAIANPQSTANDLAKIVSMDQASTIKILRARALGLGHPGDNLCPNPMKAFGRF